MSVRANPGAKVSAAAIRAWLESSRAGVLLPRVDEALQWANSLWSRRNNSAISISGGPFDADRIHALVRVMDADSVGDPRQIQAYYEDLETTAWPLTEFDEKLELLSRLAYIISRQYRRIGESRLSSNWEKITVRLAGQLPSVPEFLSLPEERRTEQLRVRFFMDPCVLLAFCAGLYELGNRNPTEMLRRATSTHAHILGSRASFDTEERNWFLTQIEILAGFGHKQCGNFSEAEKWLKQASVRCQLLIQPTILSARIEYLARAIDYERGDFDGARKGLAQLAERFDQVGMEKYAALCCYLDGVALKELGRYSEAVPQLQAVASNPSSELDDWVRGLALIYCAEIYAREGEQSQSFDTLSRAWGLVKDTTPMAVAHFHGVRGEILRDLGDLNSAVESYRLAVKTYEAARSKALETLVRIVLAETLLAAGRAAEALSEIVIAIQIVETLGLVREGVVAVALLRESLSRQSANRDALSTLKRALKALNAGTRP